jgi:anti-sigma regulatory factor (Ser/Thr protein kinase)
VAVNEVAANSARHGGGRGILRAWIDDEAVVCEIRDRGRIDDALVGRRQPSPDQIGGWGIWIANQMCDLVQIRSGPDGTATRLRMKRSG